jgi:hypothetical protein
VGPRIVVVAVEDDATAVGHGLGADGGGDDVGRASVLELVLVDGVAAPTGSTTPTTSYSMREGYAALDPYRPYHPSMTCS